MTRYFAWCPDYDGTQHLPCVTNDNWDHVPTKQEQEAWLEEHPGQYTAWQPRGCHFEIDATQTETIGNILRWSRMDLNNTDIFPEHHWTNELAERYWYLSNAEVAKLLKKVLTCSVHGKHPQVFRRHSAYDNRIRAVNDRVFEFIWEAPPGTPYYRSKRFWLRRRAAPITLREVWA